MGSSPYLFHVLIPIIAAILVNLFIYVYGWNANKTTKPVAKCLPPGYVIGIIWIILLGLLGYAHYLVYPSYSSTIIVVTILYCLSYTFLISLDSNDQLYQIIFKILYVKKSNFDKHYNMPDVFFNVIAFIIAVVVCITSYMQNIKTIYFTSPFVLWTLYVNICTLMSS